MQNQSENALKKNHILHPSLLCKCPMSEFADVITRQHHRTVLYCRLFTFLSSSCILGLFKITEGTFIGFLP